MINKISKPQPTTNLNISTSSIGILDTIKKVVHMRYGLSVYGAAVRIKDTDFVYNIGVDGKLNKQQIVEVSAYISGIIDTLKVL